MSLNVFDGYEEEEIKKLLLENNYLKKNLDSYFKILDKTFGKNSNLLPTLEEMKIIRETGIENYLFKSLYNKNSFTILNHEFLCNVVKIIKKNKIKNVVELGSGTSVFSKWLNVYLKKENISVNIVAIDKHEENYFNVKNVFFKTENYDVIDYMKENQEEDTLYILGWPSYNTPFAANVLKNLKFNNKVLYIGESEQGCTADTSFFELLNNFKIKNIYKTYTSFSFIYDQPFLISNN